MTVQREDLWPPAGDEDCSLAGVFQSVARSNARRIAVIDGGRRWSYAELDAASSAWAASLQRSGVRRGDRVGLMMERSGEAVVAMLAILKAGGAYVPFDPAAPAERLRRQASSADVRMLLVRREEEAPDWFEGDVSSPVAAPWEEKPHPRPPAHPDELAYIIHTSGSTNRPKGVCVTQRAVLELIRRADYCDFGPEDTVYHGMSIAFDGSTFEIWGALLTGARLVVAPPRVSIDEICALVERHSISILLLSTGLFNVLDDAALVRLHRVRIVLAGGDVMSPQAAHRFLSSHPRPLLVNGYGPTEATTFSNCLRMTGPRRLPEEAVPIGRAIPGMRAYVLDGALEPVDAGIEGELYVAGDGVAWGYLGDPALTAERFLPDPFAADGSRMYRTGDLAMEREDGEIDYLGRADRQVKIRGYRVEPGEIETCLCRQGDLLAASVVHVANDTGSSSLHAFAVAKPGAGPVEARRLLDGLRNMLPDYMVPRSVEVLDTLPLTINGKVDRDRLISRARDSRETGIAADVQAAPEPEDDLLGFLRELLDAPRLSSSDNFIDAGGASLAAMRFCAKVRERLGVQIPLALLFEADTISDVIGRIRSQMGSPALPERSDRPARFGSA